MGVWECEGYPTRPSTPQRPHSSSLHNSITPPLHIYCSASVTNAIFVMFASWRMRIISTTSP